MVKKGITPVISVVLLIMLVVAITGGAYYWMTNVQGSLQENVGSNIQQSSDLSTQSFSIVSVECGTDVVVIGLNTGNSALSGAELLTVSTIQGAVMGTYSTDNGASGTAASESFTTTASGVGLTTGSYSVRLNIGSSAQTATCEVA